MSSLKASSKVTTRRRGRPAVAEDLKLKDRRVTRLTESEGRRLNSLIRKMGLGEDSETLRALIVAVLDQQGIEDPGPDSPEALPPETPRRRGQARSALPKAEPRSRQLQLTA